MVNGQVHVRASPRPVEFVLRCCYPLARLYYGFVLFEAENCIIYYYTDLGLLRGTNLNHDVLSRSPDSVNVKRGTAHIPPVQNFFMPVHREYSF